MNTDDFLRGQRDCMEGKPHKDGSEDYNRGYAAQYSLDQVKTEMSIRGHYGNRKAI